MSDVAMSSGAAPTGAEDHRVRALTAAVLVLALGCDGPSVVRTCDRDGDCAATERCIDGMCAPRAEMDAGGCAPGLTQCASGCVDLSMNGQHCGACGRGCAGTQTCLASTCVDVCSGSEVRCGTSCVDLASNGANCGACNRPCDAADECIGSTCVPRCVPAIPPIEVCNGVDDDCDRVLDPPSCGPDLVAWYRFDATAGPVIDSSGRGHGGDLFGGATRVPGGRSGGALMSNGATISQVVIGDHPDFAFGSAFSAETWVNVETCAPAGSDHNTIAVIEGAFLFAFTPACVLSNYVFGAGTWWNDAPGAALTPSTWQHVAMTWDGATLTTYLDGNPTGPGSPAPGPMGDPPFPLRIASRVDCCAQAFQGLLDELMLFSSTRTHAQVCADAGGTFDGTSCAL